MPRRRFYASLDCFAADGSTVELAADETRHLRDVLRLERGAEAFVFDGEGHEYRCVIDEYTRDRVRLRVESEVEAAGGESSLQLSIAVALLKGEKLDLVVQKSTELGVSRIVPIVSKLADVRLRDEADAARRVTRLRRIALEACKQSGRATIPKIEAPVSFTKFVAMSKSVDDEWRVMFSERGGRSLIESIESLSARPVTVTALIGSEGGWSDEEIELAQKCDWEVVTFGGRTLRAETAAITVTALLQHLFGDLN